MESLGCVRRWRPAERGIGVCRADAESISVKAIRHDSIYPGVGRGLPGAPGYGLSRTGRTAEARAILAELDAAEGKCYVTPMSRVWIHMGPG